MEINLPPEVAEMLQRKIAAGEYHSASDAIAMALLALDSWEELEAEYFTPGYLRQKFQAAREQPAPRIPWPEFFDAELSPPVKTG